MTVTVITDKGETKTYEFIVQAAVDLFTDNLPKGWQVKEG